MSEKGKELLEALIESSKDLGYQEDQGSREHVVAAKEWMQQSKKNLEEYISSLEKK